MPIRAIVEKHPTESFIVGLDFAPALAAGRTVASGTVQALDASGADVSGTLLVSTVAAVSGTQARVQLQSGTGGQSYTLIFTVTLDDGEVLQDGLTVSVKALP